MLFPNLDGHLCSCQYGISSDSLYSLFASFAKINIVNKRVNGTSGRGPRCRDLNMSTLRLIANSEGWFRNMEGHSLLRGHVITLANRSGNVTILNAQAMNVIGSPPRCWELRRTPLENFVSLFSSHDEVARLRKRCVPISMLTDLASIFNLISKSSKVIERRLKNHLAGLMVPRTKAGFMIKDGFKHATALLMILQRMQETMCLRDLDPEFVV